MIGGIATPGGIGQQSAQIAGVVEHRLRQGSDLRIVGDTDDEGVPVLKGARRWWEQVFFARFGLDVALDLDGRDAQDAGQQAFEGLLVVQAAELDHLVPSREARQVPLAGAGCAGQENQDDAVAGFVLDAGLDGDAHLLALPALDLARADKDRASLRLSQRVLHLLLDGLAGHGVPGAEPKGEAGVALQPPGQRFYKVLVLFAIAEEYVRWILVGHLIPLVLRYR